MTTHDINNLIERYLNGLTTPAEERQLALEVLREDAPPEWKIIAEMLGELTRDEALYDRIMAERATHPARHTSRWPWSVAASVVLGIGIFYYTHMKAPQDMAQGREVPSTKQPAMRTTIEPTPVVMQISQAAVKSPPPRTTIKAAPRDTILLQVPTTESIPEQTAHLALTEALLAEITEYTLAAESREEQIYQELLNEILLNAKELSNQPELTL